MTTITPSEPVATRSVSASALRRTGARHPDAPQIISKRSLTAQNRLAYPGEFREAWDIALRESGARSGTLYGREVGPEVLRRRLGGLDRVWVVAEPYAGPGSRWYPSDPTERVKVTVVAEGFVPGEPRQEAVLQGGVTLRLYVRRVPVAATGSPASPPAPPNPAST